ncbi:MAG: glycine cleavage system aminomethyltransferase GcvT [Rhodospirillales bacterium]|nr:glycine cleavage system aminomethyltransferase GcvT [Rhodospirillales bacterium]MCB9996791.1 glycine cleavage system aminomethyltransferase GcvT [Rhodospirillales bacterium]
MTSKTPLYDAHIKLNAKMGPFAGYDMPLYYGEGVMAEHEWVRREAGLFDVSHMGQIILSGPEALAFVEKLTPSSFGKIPEGRAKYTVLTNSKGGIIDDLIITKRGPDRFFAVINAGCKEKDIAWIKENLPSGVTLERLDDRALIALQGPMAEQVLRDVLKVDTEGMPYMWMIDAELSDGTPYYISRLGYTGEDGFELSVPADIADGVWTRLMQHGAVKPIGLAARDSLRLEMGYCLYGHDIDENTSPIEAGLSWVMGKENTGFIGAGRILSQKEDGVERQRIGVRLTEKGVAREGAEILSAQDMRKIGTLTSGGFSPSLKEGIGQGYVESDWAQAGKKIFVSVRGRNIAAEIADMPFMQARTKSMKKAA